MLVREEAKVDGYEMHNGVSEGPALSRPLFDVGTHFDGAISEDGQVMGTYLHGLFDNPEACQALLTKLGLDKAGSVDYNAHREQALERLA
ncbi:cobyric acid synthase CobQ, partial [Halomonas sp. SIMBA_159]